MSTWATIIEAALLLFIWGLLILLLPGCRGDARPPDARMALAAEERDAANQSATRSPRFKQERSTRGRSERPSAADRPRHERSLADLLVEDAHNERPGDDAPALATSAAADQFGRDWQRRPIDERAAAAAGIRKIAGKRLTLFTDVPPAGEIDRLPELFEQAIPQWLDYFGIERERAEDWRINGFLMQDKERFVRTGLLPADLPDFRHGYARATELWLFDQPSDYYRRHLLLHEGTHALMYALLGSCGPPWYMEGIAELLGTHRLEEGKLTLNHFPRDKDETPMLGRIKLVQEAVARQGRPLPIESILNYSNRAHLENEPYAWCWALCTFLDGHPKFRERFRELIAHVREPDFNRRFLEAYRGDWPRLVEQWQLFAATIVHDHDIGRTEIEYAAGEPLAAGEAREIIISAERGWQSSGIRLEAGTVYQLSAQGRYQINDAPKIWSCEPNGVTIRYHRGRPMGRLLAVIRPDDGPLPQITPFLTPHDVGLETMLTPESSGVLYFSINESPDDWANNKGQLTVTVERR